MAKTALKVAAQELRRQGYSYSHIATQLSVSKGTLSVWLAQIPYTPNKETLLHVGRARTASGLAKHLHKIESFRIAREEADRELQHVTPRDLLMIGLGLYIGEGSKSTDQCVFVNSNPAIIRFMIRWFTEALGLPKLHMRIRLHVYPDSNVEESEQYWSRFTGLRKAQFEKAIVDWRKDKKALKWGKLPHGTAHLSVRSLGQKRFGVFLARKILALSEAVLHDESIAGVV